MALIGSLPNPRNVETCCPSLRPLPTSLVPIIPGGPSSSALTPQLPHARTWEVCVLFPGKGLEEGCQGSWGAGCVPGASSCPHLNCVSCHQQENPRVTNTSLLGDPGPLPGASCRLQALGGRVGAGAPSERGGWVRGWPVVPSHQQVCQPVHLGLKTGPGWGTLTPAMTRSCLAHNSHLRKGQEGHWPPTEGGRRVQKLG